MPSYFHNSFLQKVKNSNNYLSETIFSESTQMHVISMHCTEGESEGVTESSTFSFFTNMQCSFF